MNGPLAPRSVPLRAARMVFLGLLAISAAPALAQEAAAPPAFSLDRLVPETAFGIVSVPDVSAIEAGWPRTALARIAADEEVLEFVAPLVALIEQQLGELREGEGIDLLAALGTVRGEVSLAVLGISAGDPGLSMPDLVVAIDGRDRAADLRRVVEQLVAKGEPAALTRVATVRFEVAGVRAPGGEPLVRRASRFEIRYDWAQGETRAPFRVLRDGQELASGALVNAAGAVGWTVASVDWEGELPAGAYEIAFENARAAAAPEAPDGLVTAFRAVPQGGEDVVLRTPLTHLHRWSRRSRGRDVMVLEDRWTRMDAAWVGSAFVLASRPETLDRLLAAADGAETATLAKLPLYREAMGVVADAGTPVIRAFVNVERILEQIGPMIAPQAPLLREAGILGIRAVSLSSTMDGSGFTDRVHVHAPGESRGLFRLVDGKPLDRAVFDAVPASAYLAWAFRLDAAGAYREAMRVLAEARPDIFADVTTRIEQVEGFLGFGLEKELLASLGDVAVLHVAPPPGGGFIPDVLLSVELRDPETFEECFRQLLAIAAEQGGDDISVSRVEFRGTVIHQLRLPGKLPVVPSCMISDGRFVFALLPQTLKARLRAAGGEAAPESVRDTEFFREAVGRIPAAACALGFLNLRATFEFGYNMALPILQARMGDLEALPLDWALLPSSQAISRHLGGAASGLVRDGSGLTWVSHGPLSSLALVFPLGTTAFLFVGTAAEEPAPPVRVEPGRPVESKELTDDADLANLEEIGSAFLIHYVEQGRYPDTIEGLVTTGSLQDVSVLLSPGDDAPRTVGSVRCSYEYIGPRVTALRADKRRAVVAWSKGPAPAVLFLDGSKRRVPAAELAKLVSETRARIAKAR